MVSMSLSVEDCGNQDFEMAQWGKTGANELAMQT